MAIKNKTIKQKEIGKVFETDSCYTKCSCGEAVRQEWYVKIDPNSLEGGMDCFVGFCKCGNIFVAQFPKKLEKEEGGEIKFTKGHLNS